MGEGKKEMEVGERAFCLHCSSFLLEKSIEIEFQKCCLKYGLRSTILFRQEKREGREEEEEEGRKDEEEEEEEEETEEKKKEKEEQQQKQKRKKKKKKSCLRIQK